MTFGDDTQNYEIESLAWVEIDRSGNKLQWQSSACQHEHDGNQNYHYDSCIEKLRAETSGSVGCLGAYAACCGTKNSH